MTGPGPTRTSPASGPPAVIVTVGDELLNGERTDTNARWLGEALTALSFEVREILTVGDGEHEIRSALVRAHARARSEAGGVVVVTGGLGPTLDDRTREAAAAHYGVPLEEDPAILEILEDRFRARGYDELPPLNRRIARVPRGARVLPNPVGSAPGLEFAPQGDRPLTFLLPGVPAEMEALLPGAVQPRLEFHLPDRPPPPVERVVLTTGIPESSLAGALEPLLEGLPGLMVQYRPSVDQVELRFSATGPGADLRLDQALSKVEAVLAPFRFGGRGATLEGSTLAACRSAGWRVAVAESCTGGMLGARLTNVPGSSDVVVGGVIAYDNAVKSGLLEVPPELLATHGAVSAPVAEAMARGVRRALAATVAISVTGVAGPGGARPHAPVGTVWFGLVRPGGPEGIGGDQVQSRRQQFPGDRDEVRRRAVQFALQWVRTEALAAGARLPAREP